MLGVFYAYMKEYKHNDCFLKTKKTFTICAKYNFIKLQNVCDQFMKICEINVFSNAFINHFTENP